MKACLFCVFGMIRDLVLWFYNFAINRDKVHVRGSFMTTVTTFMIWYAFFNIIYLVHYEVTHGIEKLSVLSGVVATVFGTMGIVYGAITAVYNHGKAREREYELRNGNGHGPQRSAEPSVSSEPGREEFARGEATAETQDTEGGK